MNSDDLTYRKAMDRNKFGIYLYDYVCDIRHKEYEYALLMFKSVMEYAWKNPTAEDELIKEVFYSHVANPFRSLLDCFISKENDQDGDPGDVIANLTARIINYGDEKFCKNKDELKDFLLEIIPELTEGQAAAFIRDDLLSEEGLASKRTFWKEYGF